MTSLTPFVGGAGRVEPTARGARLVIEPQAGYSVAQLDDTVRRPRSQFRHRPPFQAHVRARASRSDPVGTLGFGLWNDPFAVSLGQAGAMRKLPASPQALWFFYGSPPNDMAYATPGVAAGWKAASLRSPRLPAALVVAGGAGLMAAGLLRRLQAWLVAWALSRVQAAEAEIEADLADWHSYELDWRDGAAEFRVDGELMLRAEQPPEPPLGFVLWIDNQYAVISRTRGIRFGLLPTTEPQWLEVADLHFSNVGQR